MTGLVTMLIFWSFHIRISHHYETVELQVQQTSLEGIAGYVRYLSITIRQLLLE